MSVDWGQVSFANEPMILDSPRIRARWVWFEDPAALALRLHQLIRGSVATSILCDDGSNTPRYEPSWYFSPEPRWHIDPVANNWWLHLHPKDYELNLCYRYGKTSEEWNALKIVIEMLLK